MEGLFAKYIDNDLLADILSRIVSFAVSVIAAYIIWRILSKGIRRYRRRNPDNSRSETISVILESLLKYVIYFFIFCQGLDELFKVNVMSLLAAAGVVGIAIAFGAQDIVKDVITGFFIIFEGKFEVGDVVTIDGFTGTVDSITLRCTTLRNYMGDVYIVPNGSVEKVLNHNKSPREVSLEVSISYESDIDAAMAVLKECGERAREELEEINGEITVAGVVALGESGVTIRALVPCKAGAQYEVEREMLRRIKYAFDENGIEIPYNRLVVIRKDEIDK